MLGMAAGLLGGGGGGGLSASSSATATSGPATQGDYRGGSLTSSGFGGFNVNFGGQQSLGGFSTTTWLAIGAGALVLGWLLLRRK